MSSDRTLTARVNRGESQMAPQDPVVQPSTITTTPLVGATAVTQNLTLTSPLKVLEPNAQ